MGAHKLSVFPQLQFSWEGNPGAQVRKVTLCSVRTIPAQLGLPGQTPEFPQKVPPVTSVLQTFAKVIRTGAGTRGRVQKALLTKHKVSMV